jgi:hypothetical protein
MITSCTTINGSEPWCSTLVDENSYHQTGNWIYCPGPTYDCIETTTAPTKSRNVGNYPLKMVHFIMLPLTSIPKMM